MVNRIKFTTDLHFYSGSMPCSLEIKNLSSTISRVITVMDAAHLYFYMNSSVLCLFRKRRYDNLSRECKCKYSVMRDGSLALPLRGLSTDVSICMYNVSIYNN